jgi:hypothetical protein
MPDPMMLPDGEWTADVSIAEVVRYASYNMPVELLRFAAAERKKDNGGMVLQIAAMRHIITRMDQYRRMKVKQWNAADAATPKQESSPT